MSAPTGFKGTPGIVEPDPEHVRMSIAGFAEWLTYVQLTKKLADELGQALERAKTTFFYIRNLSHDAWRDPANLEAVCKRIEEYAKMEYDLAEKLLKKAGLFT